MTLNEIMQDILALEEDLLMYERKYGILSETFYESFSQGDEPPDDTWVLDWGGGRHLSDFAKATKTLCRTDSRLATANPFNFLD